MTRTIKFTLAYDGAGYCGWQRQPGRPTIQGVLEKVLREITGETIAVEGSGRTDAGVHALGQVAGFRTECRLAPDVLMRAVNSQLPDDIVVREAVEAASGFDACRHAVRKRYRYVLHDSPLPDVFRRRFVWRHRRRMDDAAMHRAAQALVGRHDFRSFETHWPSRASSVRTILDLVVHRGLDHDDDLVAIEVEADGFLYNMVRSIAGTLVEVGRGRKSESWPAEVLAAQDRAVAGMTAPPHGLFLLHVRYE